MKRMLLALVFSASALSAFAEQGISLGYAHGKISDGDDLNGVNLKYQNDAWGNVGIVGSISYMSGDIKERSYMIDNDKFVVSGDNKYISLTAGPSLRVHDRVRLYGLIGVARTKATGSQTWFNYGSGGVYTNEGSVSGSRSKTALAYGIGAQLDPAKNVLIDVAYEGAQSTNGIDDKRLNGLHIGIGYRF